MMDDMAEAKRIAAGLSDGMSHAMLQAGYSFYGIATRPGRMKPYLIKRKLINTFPARGLTGRESSFHCLTPLGLAVRAALLADPSSTGERGE